MIKLHLIIEIGFIGYIFLQEVEPDIDELLAAAPQLPVVAPTPSQVGFNPLSIQLKCLNPENEMKRKFGNKVVSNDTSR